MGNPIHLAVIKTDMLGLIGIAVSSRGLLRLRMNLDSQDDFLLQNLAYQDGKYEFSPPAVKPYLDQIQEYLAGELHSFSLAIDWASYTDFQHTVLQETLKIPYGETRSYGEIAGAIGNPRAARAVGQAEKSNQVPLVVPCHRVIGSDGSMTGYGGNKDTDLKARLLRFERENAR